MPRCAYWLGLRLWLLVEDVTECSEAKEEAREAAMEVEVEASCGSEPTDAVVELIKPPPCCPGEGGAKASARPPPVAAAAAAAAALGVHARASDAVDEEEEEAGEWLCDRYEEEGAAEEGRRLPLLPLPL